ncbi:SpoIID/LytB domain-containing protein [Anaerocolumna sp. MB42-C2]|uniref:SpoIID/LytB domain-containing protein n=1 Tax=Anaerocolumna sp. MB42-C2 TaxID=3070997 RepID=UPI0027E05392|nr:SpoIID/LytB domain-containing protein [Anaerocolumna sp. MB42-C2]WMJ89648.1 SpoIID/LytB domain-containing protein [Anaerocolumna sp. MB42-C2]
MKKKLWLMSICICLLIIIFAGNIYKQLNQNKELNTAGQQVTILDDKNKMTVKEALRLLGFLGMSKDQDSEELLTKKEEEYFSFSDGKTALTKVCNELSIKEKDVTDKLSFDLLGGTDSQNMTEEEFLDLFESILAAVPIDKKPVTEITMFVLGKQTKQGTGTEDVIVTDQGHYTYTDTKSYEDLYTNGILNLTNKNTVENAGDKTEETTDQKPGTLFQPDNYIDCKVMAYVSGNKLVYVKDILKEETTLHNVWITSGESSTVTAFLNDISRDFTTRYKLSKEIKGQIGDLVIQDKEIIKISIKPDKINGKVLVANQDYIEIEGYGKVDLDDNYKIYKIYDELSMEVTNSILVGYTATDFVVADGKIVAALIKEAIKAKNIRVLIKTSDFKDIYHDKVQLTATKDFTLTAGDTIKSYKAGKKITIEPNNKLLKEGRIRIETKSENGKIKLLSIKRSEDNPSYRGAMEISSAENGLIVINELPIEEYLYAVIPSEMPSDYGEEALKVQAICARSYAYNQLFANGYSQYGAHVDDSVSYQVYNNIPENDATILAVKDTYGKVIRYSDAVITAYYFSTSCGHTASLNEVWGSSERVDYLLGKMQTIYDVVNGEAVYASSGSPDGVNFSTEKVFRDFIIKPPKDTYDSKFPWYRWDVTITKADLKKSIDKNLSNRYKANPDLIQTLVGGDVNENPKYESIPVSTIGTVKDVLASKREKSGILSAIVLVGSDCTIKVQSEYNIRTLLAPIEDEVVRKDKSKISDLGMLPSAFFVMDKSEKSITFHGGGYGHGVGMSQNGVKAMADSGKNYEEIIKHYYTGVDIGYIY